MCDYLFVPERTASFRLAFGLLLSRSEHFLLVDSRSNGTILVGYLWQYRPCDAGQWIVRYSYMTAWSNTTNVSRRTPCALMSGGRFWTYRLCGQREAAPYRNGGPCRLHSLARLNTERRSGRQWLTQHVRRCSLRIFQPP